MVKHYKEAPWWWYIIVLVFSFILGLVVVVREDITLPAWAYVVALLVGMAIAPLVSLPRRHIKSVQLSHLAYPFAEYPSSGPLRQRNCHEQLVQDVGGPDGP